MEKSEAIEFCKVHYLNYLGLAEGLLYTDYCAQVAVLLYSAFKANSKGSIPEESSSPARRALASRIWRYLVSAKSGL